MFQVVFWMVVILVPGGQLLSVREKRCKLTENGSILIKNFEIEYLELKYFEFEYFGFENFELKYFELKYFDIKYFELE